MMARDCARQRSKRLAGFLRGRKGVAERLGRMKELLSERGSIPLQCDTFILQWGSQHESVNCMTHYGS
jgi:hypothetical protein